MLANLSAFKFFYFFLYSFLVQTNEQDFFLTGLWDSILVCSVPDVGSNPILDVVLFCTVLKATRVKHWPDPIPGDYPSSSVYKLISKQLEHNTLQLQTSPWKLNHISCKIFYCNFIWSWFISHLPIFKCFTTVYQVPPLPVYNNTLKFIPLQWALHHCA